MPDSMTHPGETKELRLALVLYGGVSLAIYMHGTTKELHRLVRASALLDRGANPDADSASEVLYRELLLRMAEEHPEGVRTSVVVDAVAGTSAGGINGVFLAKALAHNRSQDELRDLWLTRGDIKQLLRGPAWLPIWLKAPWLLLGALRRAPLRGDAMSVWLYDALEGMDEGARSPELATLMPDRHKLELFVTVTDFYGYDRQIPIADPKLVHDRRHRHVLEFGHDGAGLDRFTREHNGALAFAARTTSCFPGAFPPVSLDGFAGYLKDRRPDLSRLGTELFRFYELAGASARDTHFVDGGVLDNRPFAHAIAAIRERPASVEVDRRLLYLEPDPGGAGAPPTRREPGTVATILGAVSGIPRHEPILDDLLDVARMNERSQRVRDIVETSFDEIAARVEEAVGEPLTELSEDPESENFARWRKRANEAAEKDAGFGYATYVRLKISGVVDRYAATVCALLAFPGDSSHGFFVRAVLRCWAEDEGLFLREMPPSERQVDFLRSFDLEYTERRLRFVVAGLNWWYRQAGKPGFPSRAELNAAKARLYRAIGALVDAMGGQDPGAQLGQRVSECFDEREITEILRREGADPRAFVAARNADLVALAASVESYFGERLRGVSGELFRDLYALSATWDPERRKDILVRYLGFPFWDVLLYPFQALAAVGERDRIEVMRMSPRDATLLRPPGGGSKLKGVRIHHFGAFFKRADRENDYLWGRLDGAERLIGLLLGRDHPAFEEWCRRAFGATLDEEAAALPAVAPLVAELRRQMP